MANMLRKIGTGLVAFLVIMASSAVAAAAQEPDAPRLRFGITLAAKPAKNHFRDAVQRTQDFYLMDGTKKIVPSRVGFVYRIERTDGQRILLSMPSQGLYGWAPKE